MARSPQQDFLIVLLLMAALGVAWYYTGGNSNDLARAGLLFKFSPTVGGGVVPTAIPGVEQVGGGVEAPPPSTTQTISNYLGTFTEERSPYAAYVTLEQANASSDIGSEYLTIRVSNNAPSKVTVTGWRLESTATGMSGTVPMAAELPFQGSVNATSPASLSPGQQAYVVTGRSPNGTSFRTNLCTGYFEQFQNFTPALKIECPNPQEEAQNALTTGSYNDTCYDFVRAVPRCTLVTTSVPLPAGEACNQFVTTQLTYVGCINKHKNDPGFYKDTWYLFLNRDQELWRSRSERIRLLDENGKVVGVVSY